MYCTYITIYTGTKLPPFYVGSKDVASITKGYHGSPNSKEFRSAWKDELSMHPELFKTKIISTHETRKDAFVKERYLHLSLNVVDNPLYVNKAVAFSRSHMKGREKGCTFSERHKQAIRDALRRKKDAGWIHPTKGNKRKPVSEDRRKKISESVKNVPKKVCPHCLSYQTPTSFSRYHGDKCKSFLSAANLSGLSKSL